MKDLIIFDVDNTIIKGQSQNLLLSYLLSKKEISFTYYLTILPWFLLYKLQLINNPKKVMTYAYSFIKGKSLVEIDGLMSRFLKDSLKENIFPEAIRTIQEYKNSGGDVVLISNAPDIIISRLAHYLGIKDYLSTELEIKDGVYTGMIKGPLMYGNNKLISMQRYANEHGYDLKKASAYGDHGSDLPVLGAVSHPVAINPSSLLLQVAKKNHWPIFEWSI